MSNVKNNIYLCDLLEYDYMNYRFLSFTHRINHQPRYSLFYDSKGTVVNRVGTGEILKMPYTYMNTFLYELML